MRTIRRGAVPLWQFDRLAAETGLFHFISGRAGGLSSAPYDTLNLGLHTADEPANIRGNRERLYAAAGVPPNRVASCMQVHGNNVIVVGDGTEHPPEGDGLATAVSGLLLMLMMADCVPVIIYDPRSHAAGVAHAGWRGTVTRVVERLVQKMVDDLGCRPASLLAGIGPSIGPCCYEVGEDVIARVRSELPNADSLLDLHAHGSKAQFDLWQANWEQLLRSGVPSEQIETAEICTKCHCDEFFSDRARRPSGRFGAGIMLL